MDGSTTDFSAAPQLDPREQHFRIPGPRQGLSLFLRFLPAEKSTFQPRRAVLYVHGSRIALMGNRGATLWAKRASTSGDWISMALVIRTAIRK
jgi:hypothetical protein